MTYRRKDKRQDAYPEEERFEVPPSDAREKNKKESVWLKIFCPEASCEIDEPTQAP